MLRRVLRSLPRSSSAPYKHSPTIRPRTIIAPLRPSFLIFLGVSITTVATFITIHGDTTQPTNQTEKLGSSSQTPSATSLTHLAREQKLPSPTADETFDLFSDSGIPEEQATNVNRIDGIILPSNSPCEDTAHHLSVRFSGTLNYSLFGVYDGHNGSATSKFLEDNLIHAVLGELAQLYSEHAAASKPEHVDIENRFSFMLKEAPDGSRQVEIGEEGPGVIQGLHTGGPDPNPLDEEIDQSIKKAFLSLDSLIVDEIPASILNERVSKEEGIRSLALATSGSCALLGVYNNVKRTLKVAITGDSRAVLGRRVAVKEDTYAYETHVLSADQNGNNPHEVERLEAAHPGEKVVEGGRVLGWGLSRAFGDAACKWTREIQERMSREYLGDWPRANCLTPPYFTAEPEITTTTIRKGDFVVLASDGLWDCLTSEEVVGLVGGWLETRGEEVKIGKEQGIGEGEVVMLPVGRVGVSGQSPRTGFGKGKGYGWPEGSNGDASKEVSKEDETTIWERTDLPVTSLKADETPMYKWWRGTKRFVNVDDNVAVHLARNALGGADRDLTAALLRLSAPRSRRFRDDISIQVVFFD